MLNSLKENIQKVVQLPSKKGDDSTSQAPATSENSTSAPQIATTSTKMSSIPKTCKAIRLYEPKGQLKIEEIDVPEPQEGEVLIKVHACGVCHSDHGVQQVRACAPVRGVFWAVSLTYYPGRIRSIGAEPTHPWSRSRRHRRKDNNRREEVEGGRSCRRTLAWWSRRYLQSLQPWFVPDVPERASQRCEPQWRM